MICNNSQCNNVEQHDIDDVKLENVIIHMICNNDQCNNIRSCVIMCNTMISNVTRFTLLHNLHLMGRVQVGNGIMVAQ